MIVVKETRINKVLNQEGHKQLFTGRLHEIMIELISDSSEKGDVLGDKVYHNRIERLGSWK